MMKQTRMIRISFFIVTALIICAFWGGFYFGGSLSGNADSGIQIASVEDQTQEAANQNADDKKENTVAKNETVESMNALSEEKYYLKASGEYLSVYFADTDRLYFETSLKVSDLPEKLRKMRFMVSGLPVSKICTVFWKIIRVKRVPKNEGLCYTKQEWVIRQIV